MSQRIQQLIEFLNDTPNDPFLQYALATEYLKVGQTDDALRYFEGLRSNHPDYVGTFYHLGKLYEALGMKDEAVVVYEEGMVAARKKRDMHALTELQAVHRGVLGLEDDEDDWE